jgi:murein DD-endopeptidase MepM/ murein hydrolase activator NlpD
MLKVGKALLATGLAGAILLGLQVPAHAKTAESDTRLAVANTVKLGNTFVAPKQLAASATITVTVVSGDTLSGLASRHCGNGAWTGIYNDNRSVVGGNPNLIYPGQRLVITCASGNVSTAPSAPAQTAVTSSGWVPPVNACVVSGYGWRWGRMHEGVDLAAGYGTAIRAATGGTVSVGWQSGGAGNYTMINHGNGVWTVYMHQSSFAVKSGWVNAGQVIGYVGATGDAQGPHLHFEVHTGGLWNGKVDPVPFMANRGASLGC